MTTFAPCPPVQPNRQVDKFSFSPKSIKTPQVMGTINVTPDSFYHASRHQSVDSVLTTVEHMLAAGADIIDIGGESSRPFAEPVHFDDEYARVIPVIDAVRGRFDCVISVDTYKPGIMSAAIEAGVSMVNDIYALQHEGAIEAVRSSSVAICLMHMQGKPKHMQLDPDYPNGVVPSVIAFLQQRRDACVAGGIATERLIFDPGFGFGKRVEHNLQLLRSVKHLSALGVPLLVGLSRKSFIGHICQRQSSDRLAGSLAAATLACLHGASIIRTHDVAATVDVVRLLQAYQLEQSP